MKPICFVRAFMNTMGTMRDYETEHVQVRFIKKSNFIKTKSATETESKPGTEKDHRSHKNKTYQSF